MSYAGTFLKSRGKPCVILRNPEVDSKLSIKRSTKSSRDLGSREAYWEGLILSDVHLQSGEVIEFLADKYLVQSVNTDLASGETACFLTKCNAIVQHKRCTEVVDENNNVIPSWIDANTNVPAYVEVVTYALRQYDPGLLDQTRYIIQISKLTGALMLDRFEFEDGEKYQVVSIDPMGMPGVLRIQLGVDTRS